MIQSGHEGYKDIRIDKVNDTISYQEPGSEKRVDVKIQDFVSSIEFNDTTSNRLLNEMSFPQLREVQNIAERIHMSVPSNIIAKIDSEAMKAAMDYLGKPEVFSVFMDAFPGEPDEKILDRLNNLIKEGCVHPRNERFEITEIKLKSLLQEVAHLGLNAIYPISMYLKSPQLQKALKTERRDIVLGILRSLQSAVSAIYIRPDLQFFLSCEASKINMQMKLEVICSYVDELPDGLDYLYVLPDQLKTVVPPQEGLQNFYSLVEDWKEKRINDVEISFLVNTRISFADYRQMEAEIIEASAPELEMQAGCYVVRQKNFIELYEYSPDQIQYGIEMGLAVKLAERLVKEKGVGGKELIQFFAGRRQRIATIQKTRDFHAFGTRRLKKAYSPCIGPYYGQIPQELRKNSKSIKWDDAEDYKQDFELPLRRTPSQKEDIHFFEIKGRLPGDKEDMILNVLGIDIKVPPEECLTNVKALSIILHVGQTPAEFDRILDHAATLFDEAIRPHTPVHDAEENLIRAFWWICQAKPWERGDPSIAEMLMKTGFALKGIPLRPWKEATIPWVQVMLKGEEDFVASFDELLG